MKYITAIIGAMLLAIVFGIYIYGIYCAIRNIKIIEPLDTFMTSVGAILLTNFGVVLGIAANQPGSSLARVMLFANSNKSLTVKQIIQFIAVVIYLLALIACFIDWASHIDSTDSLSPLVIQNVKTLFGVVAAYLAFILGVKTKTVYKLK